MKSTNIDAYLYNVSYQKVFPHLPSVSWMTNIFECLGSILSCLLQQDLAAARVFIHKFGDIIDLVS